MKNGSFIGVVASLLVLIAVALWQFTVLTSDARVGGVPIARDNGPLDSDRVKPALAVSPR